MREAMENGRIAARQRLADAYRGQLVILQQQFGRQWAEWLLQCEQGDPDAQLFATLCTNGTAKGAICYDTAQTVVYPRRNAGPPTDDRTTINEPVQQELRELARSGKREELIALVLHEFADVRDRRSDSSGRLLAPNAELLALELAGQRKDERLGVIAGRLERRLSDYESSVLTSPQRIFLMRAFQQFRPAEMWDLLIEAESLSLRFLDSGGTAGNPGTMSRTKVDDVWAATTPSRRLVLLLRQERVRELVHQFMDLPAQVGATLLIVGPGEDVPREAIVTGSVGQEFPGWQIALQLVDPAQANAVGEERSSRYLVIGTGAIVGMLLLGAAGGRKMIQELRLARMKNDMVANVTHELKTPLTSMRALVETLLDSDRLEETRTREYLQLMAAENSRLSRLIDNFLTFSKLERHQFRFAFEAVQPGEIVHDAVNAFGERARRPGCSMTVEIKPDLPVVRADRDALATAVLNLLENAWKYTGETKEIAVEASYRDGRVIFAVRDNGPGISREQAKCVFDRFYRADTRLSQEAGGCGLGLSIVRAIAHAHGGDVSVAADIGVGSTFFIWLPTEHPTTSA